MLDKNAAPIGQLLRRGLFGAGDIAQAGRRLATDAYGVYDDTLGDAKRLQRIFKRTDGLTESQLAATRSDLFRGLNDANYDNVQSMQDILRQKDPTSIAEQLSQRLNVDVSPEQAAAIRKEWGSGQSWAETLTPMLLGDEPLKVWQERIERGGLVGKGGLLTAELAPSRAVREGVKSVAHHLAQGNTQAAGRAARGAALPATMYGAGLALSYGLPTYTAGREIQQQRAQGQTGVRAAAGNAVTTVANLVFNPLGILPGMAVNAPVERVAQRVKSTPMAQPSAPAGPQAYAAAPVDPYTYDVGPQRHPYGY